MSAVFLGPRPFALRRLFGVATALSLACGCGAMEGPGDSQLPDPPAAEGTDLEISRGLDTLRAYEADQRAKLDLQHLPRADQSMGPDPYALIPLAPGTFAGAAFAGVLRGASAVVLLDAGFAEVSRIDVGPSPTGLTQLTDGRLVVASELSGRLFVLTTPAPEGAQRTAGQANPQMLTFEVPDALTVRDVAAGPDGLVYVIDEARDRLRTISIPTDRTSPVDVLSNIKTAIGPVRLLYVDHPGHPTAGAALLVQSVLAHQVDVFPVEGGRPVPERSIRLSNNGPFFGMAAVARGDALYVALGGTEDHPLDRMVDGIFGYVDSFVSVYRLGFDGRTSETPLWRVNSADYFTVTPKALSLRQGGDPSALQLIATGYGSDRAMVVDIPLDGTTPQPETIPFVPGSQMAQPVSTDESTSIAFANPLLDAWVMLSADRTDVRVVPVSSTRSRTKSSRLGEALFFTTLMAPKNATEGRLSRFTCETCHYEGYVDGRTHHTGRGEIHAVTKPLLGLFSNRPHFSRALDPDLTSIAHNEFRVAGKGSELDPWFALRADEHRWLEHVGYPPTQQIAPVELRRSLMEFLISFNHRPNPMSLGRSQMTSLERRGATLFRERCEGCHAARLDASDAGSRVPFERWESVLLTPEAPIVWGRAGYEKTDILPYVHRNGARVPALRRLYKKRPYFTNGAALDLAQVLHRVGMREGRFTHWREPTDLNGALSAEDARALEGFLALF